MPRTRFLRTDQAGSCTAAINVDRQMDPSETSGNETITAEIGPQDVFALGGRGNFEFTTAAGDPGGDENLPAASVFSAVLDVTVADSPITYIADLFMADDVSCAEIGSGVRMTESPFSGMGTKTANFTWDPEAGDRWNLRVGGIGNGMHGDPTGTLTLRGNNATSIFTAPDPPVRGTNFQTTLCGSMVKWGDSGRYAPALLSLFLMRCLI